MQHWSVYLTMSHESNWHPSEWTISACFDGETAERSSGEDWASIARWVMGSFQYLPRATSKNIENHDPGERMIWHQSICQNSKHSREAENSVILTRSLWMKPQRMCSTTKLGTYVIKELKLYDECCDQLLLSGEPNSAYIEILSTSGLKNRSMRLRGTVAKAFFLLDAPSNDIRRSALHSKSAGIVILQKCFESPTILCHNQRDEVIFHLINIIYNCLFSAQTKTLTKLQLSKIK